MGYATVEHITMDFLNSQSMRKIFEYELFKVKAQDKEDVKNDSIVRILKALSKHKVRADKLTSFCQTVVRRTVVDYFRYRNRKIEANTDVMFFSDGYDYDKENEVLEDGEESTTLQSSSDYLYELSDVRLMFERNKKRFTPSELRAVEKWLYDETAYTMTVSELSRELHIDKSHATRAMKKLREICGA